MESSTVVIHSFRYLLSYLLLQRIVSKTGYLTSFLVLVMFINSLDLKYSTSNQVIFISVIILSLTVTTSDIKFTYVRNNDLLENQQILLEKAASFYRYLNQGLSCVL